MVELQTMLSNLIANFNSILKTIKLKDIIDILVIAYLLFQAFKLVRETRAMQLVKGIMAILLLYFISSPSLLNMIALHFVIQNILAVGLIAFVVLFQPEMRRALEHVGRTKLGDLAHFGDSSEQARAEQERMVTVVCEAASVLSSQKTGALMVIERQTRLGEIINTGTVVDAYPSTELICNLFFINSPLHDGAMVFRGTRIYAAGCFLPLSNNMEISRELGTRHRAALGMSEVSDAVIVVVSEETGAISVALESKLQRKLSVKNLDRLLRAKLLGNTAEEAAAQPKKRFPFWKGKSK
ncbi:diadenylate cyclase CdaA [Oscillospiraceae bacterium MB08-C2-2]|nr:diadenylate cyclase CdaA [Oscillospiraceae bacterium MB08-C2-2]